jgi:hypothetical protein
MTFLPQGYEVPQAGGNYYKFVKGENRFRIMGSPILGYEYWEEEDGKRKPIRSRMDAPIDVTHVDDPSTIKHFWAMVVYNYEEKKLQIMEITQKTIQRSLRSLSSDPDWGSPVQKYDIVVKRSGDGLETEYEVMPKPATPMDPGIVQLYHDTEINLDALYDGADPFAPKDSAPVTDEDIEKIFDVKK